ncbi:unnamed protein product [Diamesa tonsa]
MLVLQYILIILITAFAVLCGKFRWNRRHLYRLAAKIHGPKGLPLFGVALKFLGKNPQGIFKQILAIAREFPSPSKFWAGHLCFVVIDKPDDLQIVLNSQDAIDKPIVYELMNDHGLIIDGGDLWRSNRKLLNPAFNHTIVQTFSPMFNEKSRILVKVLAKHLNKGEFDAYHPLSGCTLDSLLSTSFGLEKDIQNDPNNWLLECMRIQTQIINDRIFKIWLHFKPIFILTKQYQMHKKYVQNGIYAIIDKVLKEKELQYNNKSIDKDEQNGSEDNGTGVKKPQIFVDQLFKMKKHFTMVQIRDELNTFLVTGHETTALAMSGALLMLALHQKVQEKLVLELENVFESIDQETENEMLNKLPYLDMVIKETLRLLPVAPIIGREATKDIELESCVIPAGANIISNIFKVQRDSEYWGDDAHLFNPDRFLPENISKVHPYAYLPFSKGPRNCIGMKYAMNVIKIVLTHILRNYKVTTNLKFKDLEYKVAITLRIKQNCMIKLEKRKFKEHQQSSSICLFTFLKRTKKLHWKMLVLQYILIILITAFSVWYVKFRWNRRNLYRLAAKIHGPKGLPLFGVAFKILGKNSHDTYKQILAIAREFPSPSKIWAGHYCVVVIDKPDDLQVVFNSQDAIDKSIVYEKINKHGLLVDGGDLWRSNRKLLNPAFNHTMVQTFSPMFNEKSRILVKVLVKHINKGEFDVYHPLSGCTMESLLSTSFGLEKDIQNDPNNWLLHCMEIDRMYKIWLHYKPIYMFTKHYQMEKKYVENGMFAFGDQVLKEKELQYKNKTIDPWLDQQNDNEDDSKTGVKKPQIFIDQLFKMKNHFTMDQIRDELNVFILAGHETTALTMSGVLLFLAMHQEVQDKVVLELEDVFDSVDQETENEMLNKLPYLDLVIKESLRLLPIAPVLAREATKDIELKSCTIPAGANIFLNMFDVRRNPKYWGDDAHLFNPDRFLPQNFCKVHPYAYAPFSKGPRNCIGMKYGMNVMKIALSHILRNYKVTTNLKLEDLEYKVAITLRVVQNYMVKVERRKFK